MKVQEAIQTIETFGGYKFIKRYRAFNLDTNRTETCYKFDGIVFDCLCDLRCFAQQFTSTHPFH